MVDYAAIKNEVTTQTQYASAYAAKDVNAIQALYNSVTAPGTVSRKAFVQWAAQTGMLAVITDTAATAASGLRSSALALQGIINGATDGIDLSDPINVGMLNAWVTAAVLTQANHDSLFALATHPRTVSIADLAFALYNPNGSVK